LIGDLLNVFLTTWEGSDGNLGFLLSFFMGSLCFFNFSCKSLDLFSRFFNNLGKFLVDFLAIFLRFIKFLLGLIS
jgi:hypothetical protein